jgi:hypothetical protein
MVNTMEQLSEKKLSSVTSDEGTYFSQLNFRNRVWGQPEDSYDNALAETINGLYKAELIH